MNDIIRAITCGEDGMNYQDTKQNNSLSIAHFSWEYPPILWGGLGTFATELTLKQKTHGHNISVFSVNNDTNSLQSKENWNGITVYRPKLMDINKTLSLCVNNDLHSWGDNFSFFSHVFGYNMMAAQHLAAFNNGNTKNNYDIIDAHDWLGILGGIIVKQSMDLPLVFHVHSTEHGRSLGGGSPTIRNIERQGAEAADGIITVSHAMKEELTQLGFPKEKIHVCWNGIDPHKYDPNKISSGQKEQLRAKYGIKPDEIFLFFIGRLVDVKGVKQLLQAMPIVLQSYPQIKLVILGVGGLADSIRNLITELHLEEKVILRTEFVPEDERILHYAASDLVVLPSLYEPFGIVCTEAMSMAKPVVVGARDVNGMREQVVSSGAQQCGIHINPNDPADIAWGIQQLMEKQDQWKQIGENGRKRVFDLFTWDIIAKKTVEIYRKIL